MLPDCEDVYLSFPWVKQVWLFGRGSVTERGSDDSTLLVVSTVPPKEVPSGQRKRLLAELQTRTDRPLDLRLTTEQQLAKWLSRRGGFAIAFRKHALKLFPSSSVASLTRRP